MPEKNFVLFPKKYSSVINRLDNTKQRLYETESIKGKNAQKFFWKQSLDLTSIKLAKSEMLKSLIRSVRREKALFSPPHA
jgi:hypothetical protein